MGYRSSYSRRSYSSRRGYSGNIRIEPAEYLIIWISAIPIVGALINMALLIQRKRYVWLAFPIAFFIGCFFYWQQPNISYDRDIFTDEIEMEVEDALVNIRIPKNHSLEEEVIISLVEKELEAIVDIDLLKNKSPLAYHYYTNISRDYYKAIEKGITNKTYPLLADNTYSISLYDLHYIYDIHYFAWRYAEEVIPYNWVYFISLVVVISGWLMFFLINYGIFMNLILKKKEDDDLPPFETETSVIPSTIEPSQPVQPQIIQEVVESKKLILINRATIEEIKEKLSLTALQAKFIVEERDQGGPYIDMDNFTDRTGLSAKICNRVAGLMDFSC